MSVAFFQSIDQSLLKPIEAVVDQSIANASQAITPIFQTAVVLYVVITGLGILIGNRSASMGELLTQVIKLCLIAMLIGNVSNYHSYVKDLFITAVPTFVANIIQNPGGSSVNIGNIGASFDHVAQMCESKIGALIADVSVFSPASSFFHYALYFVCMLMVYGSCSAGFVVALQAQVYLSVLISIGPLFIACAIYPATQRFALRWVDQMINFGLLQSLSVILIYFVSQMYAAAFQQIGSVSSSSEIVGATATAFSAIVLSMVSYLIFNQLPQIASALAGGVSANTGIGWAGGVANKVAGSIRRGKGASSPSKAPSNASSQPNIPIYGGQ